MIGIGKNCMGRGRTEIYIYKLTSRLLERIGLIFGKLHLQLILYDYSCEKGHERQCNVKSVEYISRRNENQGTLLKNTKFL